MNILLFSTLFPNHVRPRHGVFVENRLIQLLTRNPVYKAFVVAPVAWFPFKSARFGSWSENAGVTSSENRKNIIVDHPRFITIPKVGMSLAPLLLALGAFRRCATLHRQQKFDLIDAHYVYPDGVAAVLIGKWLKVPVVITARGSDINVIPEHFVARCWIKWAIKHCHHAIAVSDALRKNMLALGAEPDKVTTIRNGTDPAVFNLSADREKLRQTLNWNGYTVLSVGNLVPLKGHHVVLDAISKLPDCQLVIVGKGTELESLQSIIAERELGHRVSIMQECTQQQLAEFYNAADALVLASSREGMPNVVLEALACGTPVIATAVGGIPEVLNNDAIGILAGRDGESIRKALLQLKEFPRSRQDIANYSKRYGWEESIVSLDRCLRNAIDDAKNRKPTLEIE